MASFCTPPSSDSSSEEASVGGLLHTRIARYHAASGTWEFFLYPLDPEGNPPTFEDPGFTGLSEISVAGQDRQGNDVLVVVERDQGLGAVSVLKKIYAFTLEGRDADSIGCR